MSAVVLVNPKYPHNVGGAIRACAAFGIPLLAWTGHRIALPRFGGRFPREERMREFKQAVSWIQHEKPLTTPRFTGTPIAVEIHPGAEPLTGFEHPDDAVYVFGPEDGSLPKSWRVLCHRFVVIPTHHCLNLAAAVNVLLYDRRLKRQLQGKEPTDMRSLLLESRGPHSSVPSASTLISGHLWEDDD